MHDVAIASVSQFAACVHCGLCLSSCPTYVETGNEADSPRGRIYLMKALSERRITPSEDVVRHLDLCLGCRACETACPSGVQYGALIEGARSFVERETERKPLDRWRRRLLAGILPERRRMAAWRPLFRVASALRVPHLATAPWLPRSLRRLAALLPDASSSEALPEITEPEGEAIGTVALLSGCVADVFFSRVNVLSIRLLALAGYRVVVPSGQVCCGALLVHLGRPAEAERLARRNTNAFLAGEIDWIATTAAGCGAMMREYGNLLGRDARFARGASELSTKVRDVTELLAAGRLPEPPHSVEMRVAYHDACHLAHGQGVREAPRALLRSIRGVELLEIADSELCCGSAGTYNLTEPEMAWRLGERKARTILDVAPEVVAAGNPGCIVQIRAALRLGGKDLEVVHPVELLARAHGVDGTERI